MLDIAREYVAAGISVIPLRTDGSKSPAIASWKEYQHRKPTDDELQSWFSRRTGVGIVCGKVSGRLEVFDFDYQAEETFPAWREKLTPSIRGKLCVCETGGLGYHVLFRCGHAYANTKIAKASADLTGEVLIETRGEGGYIVGVGSPLDVHSSGNPYVQTHGQPLPILPVMNEAEQTLLWQAAATIDRRTIAQQIEPYARKLRRQREATTPSDLDPSKPWDDFKLRASWDDVLFPVGWTSQDSIHWTRPEKTGGTSAVVRVADDGVELLTVFSGNAGPLAPESGGHRTWNKFSAYAAISHSGDRSSAAKAVREMGYGR